MHKQTNIEEVTIKAAQNILIHFVIVYEGGGVVELPKILQHELMPMPAPLAELNGDLRGGNKSVIADILTSDPQCCPEVTLDWTSCLVIDDQACVVALGKLHGSTIFGDLADKFVKSVVISEHHLTGLTSQSINKSESIKGRTRQK